MNAPPSPPRATDRAAVGWSGRDILFVVLGGALGGFVLVALFSPFTESLEPSILMAVFGTLIYAALLASIWLFIVRRRGVSWEELGWRWPGAVPMVAMLPLSLLILIVTGLAALLSQQIFGEVPTAREQLLVGNAELSPNDVLLLLILVSIAAPIVEEIFFRGLLQGYLRSRTSSWVAIGVSSTLFALAHGALALFLPLAILGLVLGVLFDRIGSIQPPVILHALNNAIAVMLLAAAT